MDTVLPQPCRALSALGPLPENSVSRKRSEASTVGGSSGHSQEPLACTEATDKYAAGSALQVSAHTLAAVPTASKDVAMHAVSARPKEDWGWTMP